MGAPGQPHRPLRGGRWNDQLQASHVGWHDLLPPPVLRERPRARVRRHRDPRTWQPIIPLVAEPKTTNNSFFVQDSWRAASNFTINAGIRWERQQLGDRFDEYVLDLTDNWAPRIGGVWDFAKNGRSKLFANWGRFYESIPMDINIRAFGGESTCFCYNFDPNPMNFLPDPAAPSRSTCSAVPTPVDPDLKGQYSDEWIIGGRVRGRAERERRRKVHPPQPGPRDRGLPHPVRARVFIANPGVGLGSEMSFYDYTAVGAPKVRRVSRCVRDQRTQAVQRRLAVPRELRVAEAGRQLRWRLPELHRSARPEHQLGVRLRGLPRQRRRPPDERPHTPVQVRRQL